MRASLTKSSFDQSFNGLPYDLLKGVCMFVDLDNVFDTIEKAWSPVDLAKVNDQVVVEDITGLSERITQQKIKIAIVAVPAPVAQEVADKLVDAGVKAILSYAPITLSIPDTVRVQYIDPVTHMQRMTYYLG